MLIWWLLTPRRYNKQGRFVASSSMTASFAKNLSIVGNQDDNVDLIVINHSSLLDIILMEAQYKKDVCWVGKSELNGKLGFMGVMRYPNNITIDRSSKNSMLSMIKQAKKQLKNGRPIVIFPEGTRGKKDTLLPFKNGPKALALILKAKIQPVVISGLKETIDMSSQTFSCNIPIKITYLEPIDLKIIDNDDWYKDLYDKMNTIYKEDCSKLKKL
jgi:1-acyl-sn-glycerol-3-phosphate acyltransferase